MRTKQMNKKAVLANINGLSEGDVAYCGSYGTITCISAAKKHPSGVRRFKVTNSTKLSNSGNWSMRGLRMAIESRKDA